MRSFIFYCLILTNLNLAFGQGSIAQKMEWLAKAKRTSNLFVHFDKNVYANNETVWFTGYLIKEEKSPVYKHSIMAVSLIRDIDSVIVLEDKFLMEKGLSFGSINLPDSILPGNYRFLVYTNKLINGSPEATFSQLVTIKTSIDPNLKANIKIIPDQPSINKSQKVSITATTKEDRIFPKPTNIIYRYGTLQKSTTTDKSGQLLIDLAEQKNIIDPNLYVKLINQKDSAFINLTIPQNKSKANVKFYPEGGNLINGLLSQIGWEVKDQQNRPIALEALLYKNDEIIDTIETSSYGIGKFRLLPEKNTIYTVRLIHSNLADSSYKLALPIDKGLIINIQNAVVKDTLSLLLRADGINKLNILVHNFKTEFLNIPFDMEGRIRLVKIPLTEVPKGLMTLTLLDSINRPLAERMFFAHYDELEKIAISTSKSNYDQREKITLKLKLKDIEENALISVACVQDNRIALKKMTDIESYTYLNNELNYLPIGLNGSIYKDKSYLEQILMVKGWRRYTWQNLTLVNSTDTIVKRDSLQLTGIIKKNDKKELTKPLKIGLYGNQKMTSIDSDMNGIFNLNNSDIIVEDGKKMYAFLTAKDMLLHTIKINNPYKTVTKNLIISLTNNEAILPSTIINNSDLVLNSKEKSIRLQEVIITKRSDKPNAWNANKCGDYVCLNKILNCPNHGGDGGNTPPIVGKKYLTRNGIRTYRDCNDTNLDGFYTIDGIHLEKEFYVSDYKDPQEPAFFSTIYWNYGLILNGNKEAEIEFYTSDITGKFRIVVQGITDNDVIYGEHFFEVKAKNNP